MGPVVLVLLFLVVAALGIFLVIWDGRKAESESDANPTVGSVEGNLAQLASWASEPIRGWIATNGSPPDNAEGAKLMAAMLASKARPVFYPPTPAAPDGNPSYQKTNNGFEIVFPGRDKKPVVCSFTSEGAYEGATGLGEFTEDDNSVKDPLEGVAP
jgi:hypothetical protein